MSRRLSSVVLMLLVSSLGCGTRNAAPAVVPVSGRITMNKAPLAKASVNFQPVVEDKGNPSPDAYATTDEQGNYALKLGGNFGDVDGAVVGKYRVNIGLFDRAAKGGPKQLVPPKYNRESKLTFTVPAGGTKEANFDLSSK